MTGFRYLPRAEANLPGMIKDYRIFVKTEPSAIGLLQKKMQRCANRYTRNRSLSVSYTFNCRKNLPYNYFFACFVKKFYEVESIRYYEQEADFKVAVDCIIFGFDEEGLKLLLLKRNFEPCKGEWSLMGGFLRADENLDQAAERVLRDCTGLEKVYMEQLMTFSDVGRDPGARVVSAAYFALMDIRNYDKEAVSSYNAAWVLLEQVPPLIFDHNQMVTKALGRLRRRATNCPVGFNLLP